MSELRDRIAAALQGTADDGFSAEDWLHLADAVIAELGLFRQYLVDGIISDGEPRPWEVPCESRWTTEWSPYRC